MSPPHIDPDIIERMKRDAERTYGVAPAPQSENGLGTLLMVILGLAAVGAIGLVCFAVGKSVLRWAWRTVFS